MLSIEPSFAPSQKNSCRKSSFATTILMVRWLEIRRATITKRRAKNKLVIHHPARGLNLNGHTNEEAHGASCFGAWGSNTGPGLAIPRGTPLGHSCYDSISRKIVRIHTDLTTKLLR